MILVIRSVLNRITKNPLRSSLTITNIAIGVAIITLIFNISFRLNERVQDNSLKDTNKIVIANAALKDTAKIEWAKSPQFQVTDAKIIKNSINTIQYITPLNLLPPENRIIVKNQLYHTREFLGVGKDYAKIYNLKIIAGSFITEKDIIQKHSVAVVSESAAKILFNDSKKAIGKTFIDIRQNINLGTVSKQPFKIIGVFSDIPVAKAETYGIADFLIPYSIYSTINNNVRIFVAKTTTTSLEILVASIKQLLSNIHGYNTKIAIWEGNPKDPNNPRLKDLKTLTKMITLFLGPLGMIILLVSSFGIFSIMMVSILESTREIGLRRILGSTKTGIIVHFIAEAFIFSLIGSIIGIILAIFFNVPVINSIKPLLAGPETIENIGFSSHLKTESILLSLVISQLFGSIFGFFPAFSAARISPIESLREG